MERKHRSGLSWLAMVLCMALLLGALPVAPALAKGKTYTIKWKVNGETIKKEKVKKGEMPEQPEDPANYTDGEYTYVFKGWEPEVTEARENMTYKAKFKKRKSENANSKVTITWLDDEGELIDFTEVKYGKKPKHEDPKKEPTEKYTYVFDKWEPDLVKAVEDTTYTATFKRKTRKYKITWLDDKGNVIDQTKVAYGKMPKHDDPVRKSYKFTGWEPELTKVTGDATYKATFKKKGKSSQGETDETDETGVSQAVKFTITWLDDAGNVIDTTQVKAGKKPKHDAPTKEPTEKYSYEFAGWQPKPVKATEDATYTATFEQKTRKYTITWLDDDGNVIDQTKVAYGEKPTHDNPTLPDSKSHSYVFRGWMPALTEVTGDATYTAIFDEVDKAQPEPETKAEPEPETKAEPEPETKAEPQPEVESEAPGTAEPQTYTISWLDDAGNVIDTTEVKAGEVPTHAAIEKPATEQYTYVFNGWTPEPAPAEANAAYTAVFTEVPIESQEEGILDSVTEDPDMAVGNSVKVFFRYIDETPIDFPQEYVEQDNPQPVYYEGTDPVKAATATTAYEWIGWTDDKTNPNKKVYGKSRKNEESEKPLLPEVTADSPAETVYYAVFQEIARETYNITWQNENGSEIDKTEVVKGEKPTHADPTKPGAVFDGWLLGGSGEPIPTANLPEATADATYKAHFTENDKMVTLPDVNCYAYIKNKADKEQLKTLLPTKATLADGTTEITIDWSNASPVYVDSNDGVKNDGTYTYTGKDTTGTYAVTCSVIVGPKQSGKYTYRWDSVVEDNAKAIITAWNDTEATELTVASTLDGVPVTAIDDGAFNDKDNLTSVTVPASVTAIGTGAFAGCEKLATLTLPDSLTSIGMNLIDGCDKLENMYLSVGLETTMDKDASGCYTIKHVDKTDPSGMSQTVTLPDGFPTDITVTDPGKLTLNKDFLVKKGHSVTASGIVQNPGKLLAEIEWLNDDDSLIETTQVAYGGTPAHDAPKESKKLKAPYEFKEWSPKIVAVAGPATYKAVFEKLYTIKFVNWDDTELSKKDYKAGETPKYEGETPTRPDDASHVYFFAGWDPEIKPVEADATYKAKYTSREYPVALKLTYTGSTLTKVYDTNKYGAYVKDGETVYIIKELKTIANSFKLEPADSKKADWIDGHKSVKFKLKLSQQFTSADVGEYKFKFTASLTGDDAKYYELSNEVIEVPAEITTREVVITPTSGLKKVYGTKDPVWPENTWLKKDESSPLHQNIGGLPGYAVPLDKNKQLSITNQAYILKEAEIKGTKFFPGWLTRETGEDAGTYKILVGDMKFSSNFSQTLKDEVFTITAKDIGDDNVTVDAIKDQEHTGKAITPELTVRYGSMTLKKDTDYTVEYSDNTEVSTTEKKAKVKLTGKGNFKGTKEVTFNIIKKSGGDSGGGSSGSGSGGYGYDGFGDEEDGTDETIGAVLVNGVRYYLLYTYTNKASSLVQFDEEYQITVGEGENAEEVTKRRLVIVAEPMKDPETGESILLEGTPRERYDELHLRLDNATIQALLDNDYTEILYKLENAQLHLPLASLTSSIPVPPTVEANAGDAGDVVISDDDIEIADEIEIEDGDEDGDEDGENGDEDEEIEIDDAGSAEAEDLDLPAVDTQVEMLPVDGYDFCIEQADANGLSDVETNLIADNKQLTPAYRMHLSVMPTGAEPIPTGEMDENEQPITKPFIQALPEGYTIPGVVMNVEPYDSFLTAPLEAKLLHLVAGQEPEGPLDLTATATTPDVAATTPDDGATTLDAAATTPNDDVLTPAVFDEDEDPMTVKIEPVKDGLYAVLAPADWDATPYLTESEEDDAGAEPEGDGLEEDEDDADEEEVEFEDDAEEPEEPESESVYEYAFIRGNMEYQMYYVFDTDDMVARRFVTNDTGVKVGSFTGDAETGFTITWGPDWQETMKVIDERKAMLIDKDGKEWEYRKVQVEAAEEVLNQPGYHDM